MTKTTQNTGALAKPADMYWASVPIEEIGAQIEARFRAYRSALEVRGIVSTWRLMIATYYGIDPKTGGRSEMIAEGGEEGERLKLHVNEVRALIREQIIMVTADRPNFDALSKNDTPESAASAIVAEQIIQHELDDAGMERVAKEAIERERTTGLGFVVQRWDATRGEDARVMPSMNEPEPPSGMQEPPSDAMMGGAPGLQSPPSQAAGSPGQPEGAPPTIAKAGEIVRSAFSPYDVAYDLGVRDPRDATWFVVRDIANRWDLAAEHPEETEPEKYRAILDAPRVGQDDLSLWTRSSERDACADSDMVHTYTLYHAKTRSMPEGREVFCVGDTCLRSTDLVYKRLPVHVAMVSLEHDAGVGYADPWDLLGPQQALNAVADDAVTTHDAGSTNNWIATIDMDVSVDDLGRSGQVVKFKPDALAPNLRPEPMGGPEVKATTFQLLDFWQAKLDRLGGMNPIARGAEKGSSGAQDAFADAKALKSQNGLVTAYVDLLRDLATATVELYQQFADTARTIDVVGEDDTSMVASFTKASISGVRKFRVTLANPIMRTMEGRTSIADKMIEAWPQKMTPERYALFLDTGRYRAAFKADRNLELCIASENEALRDNKPVKCLISDQHLLHIQEHLAELYSPRARLDDQYAARVFAHVLEHESMWQQLAMRPALLAATGQPPPPPPAMMGPPGMGGEMGAPPEGGGPPSDSGEPPAARAHVPGATDAANMPQMPMNPATGQRAQVPGVTQ